MEGQPLFLDLLVLLLASLPVVFICHRLRMPTVVGFILTGVIIGPSATGWVASRENVEVLADVGVILLLFTIGLEFSLRRLAGMRSIVLGAGGGQVFGVTALALGVAAVGGYGVGQAVTFGFIAAMSSTAIALKLLTDRSDLNTPHGRFALAIALFQDLSAVPMLLLLPGFAGAQGVSGGEVAFTLAVSGLGAIVIVLAARRLLPWLFAHVLRLQSRELFVAAIAVSCFGTAWLTASLGISLAIGAFLAGLVVSESEYSHQIVADIIPLRDLFSIVFFASVGMLLDLGFVWAHAGVIAALVAILVPVKLLITAAAVLPFRPSPRAALLVGAVLAQVGEFSFVIAAEARALTILDEAAFQAVLAVAVFTMLLTPPVFAAVLATVNRRELPGLAPEPEGKAAFPRRGHVVILGFGFNGRNLARVLRETSIPYVIVDLNAAATRAAAEEGHPVLYGDATRTVVLERVHVAQAAAVVLAIDDAEAVRRVVRLVRERNRDAAIVVRTRYVTQIEELYRLGANEVIPEEMETSIELFARVLQCLNVPKNVIAAQVDVVRSEHYAMLRGSEPSSSRIESIYELFTAATTATHLIRAGSPAIGRSLAEVDLKAQVGVTLVAVVRKGAATTNPPADYVLAQGDILVVLGNHAQLASVRRVLEPATPGADPSALG